MEIIGHWLAILAHRIDCNQGLYRGTFGQRLRNLRGYIAVIDANDGLYAGLVVAVNDVVLG